MRMMSLQTFIRVPARPVHLVASSRTFFIVLLVGITSQEALGFSSLSVKLVSSSPRIIPFQSSSLVTTTRLYNDLDFTSEGVGSSDEFDLETARKKLENLMQVGGGDNVNKKSKEVKDVEKSSSTASQIEEGSQFSIESLLSLDFTLPPAPPLSTIERDRRLAEIEALIRLGEGDDATKELWDLWYAERGPKAQNLIQKSDLLLSDPARWQECEEILIQLIQEYGVYFVEPINRLATLYYLKGDLEESYRLCRIILEIKPWHFGALSGIVQVCVGLGQRDEARSWAQKRLPSFVSSTSFPPFAGGPENPRRAQWVEEMVTNAQDRLQSAEQRTQKSFFGKPEEYYKNNKMDLPPTSDNGGDAWQ